MSYTALINSASPACFLILADMSSSMRKPALDNTLRSPHIECVSAINQFLETVIANCQDGEHVKPYYAICVLGYTFETGNKLTLSTLLPSVGNSIFHGTSERTKSNTVP